MSHQKTNDEVEFKNSTPIKIVPLAEDFRENLYALYERYSPDQKITNYRED